MGPNYVLPANSSIFLQVMPFVFLKVSRLDQSCASQYQPLGIVDHGLELFRLDNYNSWLMMVRIVEMMVTKKRSTVSIQKILQFPVRPVFF